MLLRREHPAWLRAVLCFLVLIASLMHLTRLPEVGGLGLLSLTQSQNSHNSQSAAEVSPSQQHVGHVHPAAQSPKALKMDCLPGHEQDVVATAVEPTDTYPNAPPAHSEHEQSGHHPSDHHPSDHHAEAHCPFCTTAAFALEAVVFSLPFVGIVVNHWTDLNSAAPTLALIRHANARAPPSLPA